KTYTITTLVTRLIAQGYPLDAILVVTFTDAAASELKVRIRKRLADCLADLDGPEGEGDDLVTFLRGLGDVELVKQRLHYAVIAFDTACIATIHSFCSLMLRTHTFESGARFDMELVTDSSGFFNQVCMDFFMTRVNNQDPLFLKFLSTKNLTPERWGSEFRQLVAKPQIKRIPSRADFVPIWDEYRRVTREMRGALDSGMDDIVATVLQKTPSIALSGQMYKKNTVPAWLAAARETLTRDGENAIFDMTPDGDKLFRFTNDFMAAKTNKGKGAPVHSFFDLCDELARLQGILEGNVIHLKLAFLDFYDQELEQFKTRRGKCFFDDLINDLSGALAPDSPDREGLIAAAHGTYQACLIDEFQDTDPRQYQIFSTLFKGENQVTGQAMPFFMIGDPKQAIYAFRRGDIFAYLEAASQCDAAYTLDLNYRSSPAMVRGVNGVFGSSHNPFLFKDIGFVHVGTPGGHQNRLLDSHGAAVTPFQFMVVPDGAGLNVERARHRVADLLVAQIQADLAADMVLNPLNSESNDPPRPLNLGDMAVLVRSHHQADLVKTALAEAGIPAHMSKTGSVYESVQARELCDILMAVQEPGHLGLIRGALCTSVFGFLPIDLARRDDGFDGMWQDRFYGWKEAWEKRGFVHMLQD
ncbi:MAG: UvrD-helicase domain-containing protein, partial [Desulfobacterales bacterium]|nr:UvrD-helicase domain-containing protein [Desulfobacterales bacterium]